MAYLGSSSSVERDVALEWRDNKDNVKDIKESLSALKSDVFKKMKTADTKNEYLGAKFKDDEAGFDKALDAQFILIDNSAESLFDEWEKTKKTEIEAIVNADDATAKTLLETLGTEFTTELFTSTGKDSMKDTLLILKTMFGDVVKFELNDLRSEIAPITTVTAKADKDKEAAKGNPFLDVPGTADKISDTKLDYVDDYRDRGYATINKDKDIENIYTDNKLKKTMESVFDDEEGKELRRGTFAVNLDKEDGLAGIIIALRDAAAADHTLKGSSELFTKLGSSAITTDSSGAITGINISKKKLKDLIESGNLTYKRKGGLDNEVNKIYKILKRAKRTDLDTFASLVQSKSDIAMAVKEWNNALEMTGQNKEKIEKKKAQKSLIKSKNVLEFLCDFNSDGQVSAEYKRKNNKEQKNQGDVGTLFGQQVMFTIEQAIAVENIKLGDPEGENVVIQNIVKNMEISDSRILDEVRKVPLQTMLDDPKKCTKESLTTLINGDPSTGNAMPEMKIFFLDAIKKINGGSEAVTPDLYDTLVGKDSESVISLYETETDLKTALDKILLKTKDKDIVEAIRLQGLVRVRETIFTKLMTALDNVEITTNNANNSRLRAAGVTKGREINAVKKELMENAITNLITTSIHKGVGGKGYIFGIGTAKSGTSESGKTTWNRGTGAGLVWDWGPGGKVGLTIDLAADIAEQYNYKKVINANLSHVNSAKYLGIEGGVNAGIGLKNDQGADLEAYAGINRQQNPEVGINQIDKQYRAVSAEIFDVTEASTATLADKDLLRAYLYDNIIAKEKDATYKTFVTNNQEHLTSDLDFAIRYMNANKFFGTDGLLAKHPKANTTSSINAFLDIIQSGNIEQRRHDVIAGLHGKLSLTKLSFGVTSNALKFQKAKKTEAPTANSNSGETVQQGNTETGPGGNESGANDNLGQDRFGIAGLYIGARISTWKNTYVPNVEQYLFTEYELGQGIGTEFIENPSKDLAKYGKYLEALYNVSVETGNTLTCRKDNTSNKLIITFVPKTGSALTLAKFLNIHATTAADAEYSLKGNTLTIGNIGKIAAYTVTEGKGVRRILSLGSENLDDTTRVTADNATTTVSEMTAEANGYQERTPTNLTTVIAAMTDTGTGKNLDTAKKETAEFFDASGNLQKPTGTEWNARNVTFTPTTIEGKAMTIGTLTITKSTDGKTYTVGLDTKTPADKLTITYVDQSEYNASEAAAKLVDANRTTTEVASSTQIETAFALPTTVSSVFTETTEKALSLFYMYNNTLFKSFMESCVEPGSDKLINATDYTTAFTNLKAMLDTYPTYATTLTNLKTLMDGTLTDEEKMLIVDKFKTMISYVTWLTDGTADGANLNTEINRRITRGDTYKTMTGPDNITKYPLTTDYRKTILANLKGETTLKRTSVENLIGFTAFYRLNGNGRKYAMTPVGGTNVLSGGSLTDAMQKLDTTDKINAQAWFINNLAVNTENQDRLVEKINLLLKANTMTITKTDLPTLFKGNEVIDAATGDKISIDLDRVFYLLGECGNESIGAQINKVNVKKFTSTTVTGSYTATGTPEIKYEGGIYMKSHSIANKVITQEKKVSGKYHYSNKETQIPFAKSNGGETTEQGYIQAGGSGNE